VGRQVILLGTSLTEEADRASDAERELPIIPRHEAEYILRARPSRSCARIATASMDTSASLAGSGHLLEPGHERRAAAWGARGPNSPACQAAEVP